MPRQPIRTCSEKRKSSPSGLARVLQEGKFLMHQGIQHCVFSVGEAPYCVWSWDLPERNLRFLDGVDADYFTYIAETHLGHIQGDRAQLASVALRAGYH